MKLPDKSAMVAFVEKAKKVGDVVQAYLDKLSELDMMNMKATVAMFSKSELKTMIADGDCHEERKAFLTVALFLKGLQNVK